MTDYNVYDETCPTRIVLDRLADKWTFLILDRLAAGPVRFNQLKREIGGISQKVLSRTLKGLERDGLLLRRTFATRPVTVEYSLTPLAHSLSDTIAAFVHWAERNIDAVEAAQARYDEAATDLS